MLDAQGPATATAAVFAMLAGPNRSWAREFVLGGWDGDPAGDCAALCNPLALRCGAANECVAYMPGPGARVAHAVRAPCAPHTGSFTRYQNSSVWIPSWTHDGVTVGMAVYTPTRNPVVGERDMNDESAGAALSIGRFARDESSGEMLIVLKDAPESELGKGMKVTVKHTRYIDAHNAQVIWLLCDYAIMIRLRSSAPEAMFSAACFYCNVTKAVRAGPLCGLTQSATGSCDCQLPHTVPMSPTDYSRFRANGVYGYGRWAGASTISCPGGLGCGDFGPRHASTVFSVMACSEGVRVRVGDRLQALAIQERMMSGAFCKPSPVPAGGIERAPPATMAGGQQRAGDAADPPPVAFNLHDAPAVEGGGLEEVDLFAELATAASVRTADGGRCAGPRADGTEWSSAAAVCNATGHVFARPLTAAAEPLMSAGLTDEQLAKKRRRQESSRLAAARSKARQKDYAAKLAQDLAGMQVRLLEVQKRHASALAVNAALKEVTQPRG